MERKKYERKLNMGSFKPQIIDQSYFKERGIEVCLSEDQSRLIRGISSKFVSDFSNIGRLQNQKVEYVDIDLNRELPKHGDSPNCPVNILELNPAYDACDIGCQYCQTTDGNHLQTIKIIRNFPQYFEQILKGNNGADIIYYASPQTEIFQRPLMDSGVTPEIFAVFRRHLERKPDSKAKMFVVSKIDINSLGSYEKAREVTKILAAPKYALRMSGSVGMMPDDLRRVIEPNVYSLDSRLEFIRLCKQSGVGIRSILFQPLLDTFADEAMLHNYLGMFSAMGIQHIKPEFITISLENITYLAQLIGTYDKKLEKALWEDRFSVDEASMLKKIRRIPPQDKGSVRRKYLQIKDIARTYGIVATLCAWVRKTYDLQDYNKEALEKGMGCMGQWPERVS